jgi:acetylglutamate kinase
MDKLTVVKIGGNIIDDEKLSTFLAHFASVEGAKILVHGGGKLATRLAEALSIPQQLVEGRRITDAETLKVVTMVYAGYINKTIVAKLQALGCNAMGLSGADGAAIQAHKRSGHTIDYGFVGDIESINTDLFGSFLRDGLIPVLAPITADESGQLLNTNADTIAQEIAKGMSAFYKTTLVFSFEKEGVLLDTTDEASVISNLNTTYYGELKSTGAIYAGMLPKLDNAFAALQAGVSTVIIGKGEKLDQLIAGASGTRIIHD